MEEQFEGVDIIIETSSQSTSYLNHLTHKLILEKGFHLLAKEEAKITIHGQGYDPDFDYPFLILDQLDELTPYYDRILIQTDGYSFNVKCLCLKDESKVQSHIDLTTLRGVGESCLTFTGSVMGAKLPVNFEIIEITNTDNSSKLELERLKSIPGLKKVSVRAFQINTSSKKVWSNSLMGKFSLIKTFLDQSLLDSDVEINPKSSIEVLRDSSPLVSYGFISFFILIYFVEMYFSQSVFKIPITTLYTMGALTKNTVMSDFELYRVLCAPFLHGGILHLLFNSISLYMSAPIIERYLGRLWLFVLFIISALGGSIFSLMINDENVISVGASGGVVGVIAAVLVLSLKLPYGIVKTQIQMRSVYMLIPALLPIFTFMSAEKVDFAAHLGGAVFGSVLLYLCTVICKWNSKIAPGFKLIQFLAFCLFSLVFMAFSDGVSRGKEIYTQISLTTSLIPSDQLSVASNKLSLKKDNTDIFFINLKKQYPNDPRSYYFSALYLSINEKNNDAINDIESALKLREVFKVAFPNGDLKREINSFYVNQLIVLNRIDKAQEAALNLCPSFKQTTGRWVRKEWLRKLCSAKGDK